MKAIALALCVTVPLAMGCAWFTDDEDAAAEDQDGASVDPERFTIQVDYKLRRYAACRHDAATLVGETWARYLDQVDDKGKAKRQREGVYLRGIDTSALRSCRRTLAAISQTGPKLPEIDEAATELVENTAEFAAYTRSLAAYLGRQGWHEDGWATLARMDPLLRSAYAAWAKADVRLEAAIDIRHFENDPLLLGVLENKRSPLEVASRAAMIRARPLVRCMTATPTADAAQDPEACTPLLDTFDAAYRRFATIYAGDRQAADKVFWMDTFASDLAEFQALAQTWHGKLSQRKAGQQLSKRETAALPELSFAYSSLVRDAETLDFDFP